jgi:dihydrodiol dehydrogenase / D-xylose 1-dehydrogenase (NADP)
LNQPYRIGVLGTGSMAESFAESRACFEGAVLHAIGSRNAVTAEAFASKYDLSHAYPSYAQLLDDPDIDIVYIATPHALHHENTLAALNAAKAVLCEKPFALNAQQAGEMIACARKNNCFLMEAMWTRFLPSIVKLRELLRAGVIGEPRLFIAGGAFMPRFDPDSYLYNKDLGGGVLLDAGVYLLSMASLVLGSPDEVFASATLAPSGVDCNDAMLLGHEGGAKALLYVSLQTRSPPDTTILGSLGEIYLAAPVFSPAKITLRVFGEQTQRFDLAFEGNGYHYQVNEVVRCLRQGKLESDVMPLAESLSVLETMDSIRKQIGLVYPRE